MYDFQEAGAKISLQVNWFLQIGMHVWTNRIVGISVYCFDGIIYGYQLETEILVDKE